MQSEVKPNDHDRPEREDVVRPVWRTERDGCSFSFPFASRVRADFIPVVVPFGWTLESDEVGVTFYRNAFGEVVTAEEALGRWRLVDGPPVQTAEAPPVVFLDVDGVLNAHESDPRVLCGQIHRDKVARLNRVLEETGARVVLSSAWRYIVHRGEATLEGMDWLLRSHGMIAGRLIGVTRPDTMVREPYSGNPAEWPLVDERGAQVSDWLAANEPLRRYVVIDDLDLGITDYGHPFVWTRGEVGLTDEDASWAIDLLT